MNIIRKVRAMASRLIRAVPSDYFPAEAIEAEPAFVYVPESELTPILAEAAEPWRVGPAGEQWYRVPVAEAACDEGVDQDQDDDDFDDFEEEGDDDA